jgi:retron-type reverse transcriptase
MLRTAVLRPEILDPLFRQALQRPGLWMPGVPMSQVRRAPTRMLLEWIDAWLSGAYIAATPQRVLVQKGDGGVRELSVYGQRDRLVQRALLAVLAPLSEPRFHDGSHGFRRGRGVATALDAARGWIRAGWNWLVDADIRRCFDSIPRPALWRSVASWLDSAADADCVFRALELVDREGLGIPQGAALSPWLCNVYLHRFDQAQAQRGVPLVRYADDFLLFLPGHADALAGMAASADVLAELGLSLHPEKSRVTAPVGVRFLGQVLEAAC